MKKRAKFVVEIEYEDEGGFDLDLKKLKPLTSNRRGILKV